MKALGLQKKVLYTLDKYFGFSVHNNPDAEDLGSFP